MDIGSITSLRTEVMVCDSGAICKWCDAFSLQENIEPKADITTVGILLFSYTNYGITAMKNRISQHFQHFGRLGFAKSDKVQHAISGSDAPLYRDRAIYMGDPDFTDVPVRMLIIKDYAAGLRASINPDKATPSDMLPGIQHECAGHRYHAFFDYR